MKTDTKPVRSRTKEYTIGGAKYNVTSVFSETANETLEQKLLKFVSERVSAEMTEIKKAGIGAIP